jgi:hypothetical protein
MLLLTSAAAVSTGGGLLTGRYHGLLPHIFEWVALLVFVGISLTTAFLLVRDWRKPAPRHTI